jgi:hypothetical protein
MTTPRFVLGDTRIGACLLWYEVVDDGRNGIMAMITRAKSLFLMMGSKWCTNMSVECWHGWQ